MNVIVIPWFGEEKGWFQHFHEIIQFNWVGKFQQSSIINSLASDAGKFHKQAGAHPEETETAYLLFYLNY